MIDSSTQPWQHELGVRCQPAGNTGHSTLSRRLPEFYEYMYTAQSGGGFVFISLGDTSAAAPLHLFHLRRLRLALQVRSHHASMLPRHHSADACSGVAITPPQFLHRKFLLIACFFHLPHTLIFLILDPHISPHHSVLLWSLNRCKHCSRNGFEPHTVSEQVRFWTGGVRQVLDEASAHECNCQNVCVPPSVMTC